MNKFSADVCERLKCYVYRLIDPRTKETFYVGRGEGNRVFAHVNDPETLIGPGNLEDDALSLKVRTIREIRAAGSEPEHIIHRHGMSRDQAVEVESALIDAYSELTNAVSGGRSIYGLASAEEVVRRYTTAQFSLGPEKLLMIRVPRTIEAFGALQATQAAWRIDESRAMKADVILTLVADIVREVFVADRWVVATKDNFPFLPQDEPTRKGFFGSVAPDPLRRRYIEQRLPDELQRKRGARNPIQYHAC